MSAGEQFPYRDRDPASSGLDLMPDLPIVLRHQTHSLSAVALVDSGASISVLPYSLGVQLGFDWNAQKAHITLAGTLAHIGTRGIVVDAAVGQLAPVRLALEQMLSPRGERVSTIVPSAPPGTSTARRAPPSVGDIGARCSSSPERQVGSWACCLAAPELDRVWLPGSQFGTSNLPGLFWSSWIASCNLWTSSASFGFAGTMSVRMAVIT